MRPRGKKSGGGEAAETRNLRLAWEGAGPDKKPERFVSFLSPLLSGGFDVYEGPRTSCRGLGMGLVLFRRKRSGRVPGGNLDGMWQINAQDFVAFLESGIQRALQMIN